MDCWDLSELSVCVICLDNQLFSFLITKRGIKAGEEQSGAAETPHHTRHYSVELRHLLFYLMELRIKKSEPTVSHSERSEWL